MFGLSNYCAAVQGQCLIWRNNRLISDDSIFDCADGDYIRFALPPHEDIPAPTRYVAGSLRCGVPDDQIRQRWLQAQDDGTS